MDTDSFVYEIETKIFCKDIEKDLKKRFDIREYLDDENGPPPIRQKEKACKRDER